jgi:hypothetical protein
MGNPFGTSIEPKLLQPVGDPCDKVPSLTIVRQFAILMIMDENPTAWMQDRIQKNTWGRVRLEVKHNLRLQPPQFDKHPYRKRQQQPESLQSPHPNSRKVPTENRASINKKIGIAPIIACRQTTGIHLLTITQKSQKVLGRRKLLQRKPMHHSHSHP